MTISSRTHNALTRIVKGLAFTAAVLVATKLTLAFPSVTTVPTTAFIFLIIVLFSAFFGDLAIAITTSLAATLCFDYFYLPPAGTLNITAFEDWISLFAFLLASVIISRLTASAAAHRTDALALARSMRQLKVFGEWLLATPDERISLSEVAREALRIFALEYCSIHVHGEGRWQHYIGASEASLSREIESSLSSIHDHSADLMDLANESLMGVKYVQINKEQTLFVVLAVKSTTLPSDSLGAIASMIGIRLTGIDELSSSVTN